MVGMVAAVKIQVTAEDIEHGTRKDAKCCPIALACKRLELTDPDVCGEYSDGIQVRDDGEEDGYWRYKLPPEAAKFVEDFDAGLPVKPFEFSTDTPRPYSESIYRQLDDEF